ncbi:hypothetical protein E3T37_01745, partial [Cryobacterium sp. TMT2-10]
GSAGAGSAGAGSAGAGSAGAGSAGAGSAGAVWPCSVRPCTVWLGTGRSSTAFPFADPSGTGREVAGSVSGSVSCMPVLPLRLVRRVRHFRSITPGVPDDLDRKWRTRVLLPLGCYLAGAAVAWAVTKLSKAAGSSRAPV